MLEELNINVLSIVCEWLSIYDIKRAMQISKIVNEQVGSVLKKTRYLQICGDYFHEKIFTRVPFESPLYFTKKLSIPKHSFCTGFVRFFNFPEEEFRYRYEFFSRKRTPSTNTRTYTSYPITINSFVSITDNKTVVRLAIFHWQRRWKHIQDAWWVIWSIPAQIHWHGTLNCPEK